VEKEVGGGVEEGRRRENREMERGRGR